VAGVGVGEAFEFEFAAEDDPLFLEFELAEPEYGDDF